MPARGPRSDLCVVVDTTSQCSNGCAASSAATKPLQAFQKQQQRQHKPLRPSVNLQRQQQGTDFADSKQLWAVRVGGQILEDRLFKVCLT